MTITKLATIALSSLMLAGVLTGGATAASATTGDALPNAAYFEAALFYCAPPAIVFVSLGSPPAGAAAIVFEDVLIGEYGGDCDTFREKEVLPRLYLDESGS